MNKRTSSALVMVHLQRQASWCNPEMVYTSKLPSWLGYLIRAEVVVAVGIVVVVADAGDDDEGKAIKLR